MNGMREDGRKSYRKRSIVKSLNRQDRMNEKENEEL